MFKKSVITIPVDIIHREMVTIEIECDHDDNPIDLIDDRAVIDKLPYSQEQYERDGDDIEIRWEEEVVEDENDYPDEDEDMEE